MTFTAEEVWSFLPKVANRPESVHLAYFLEAEDITGAIRLNGSWTEDELDAWGTELPMVLLDSLQADLEAKAPQRYRAVWEKPYRNT